MEDYKREKAALSLPSIASNTHSTECGMASGVSDGLRKPWEGFQVFIQMREWLGFNKTEQAVTADQGGQWLQAQSILLALDT